MALGLMPAATRKSTRTDLSLVWPDLKSSPPTGTPRSHASLITPGTKVFCGLPLMYGHCDGNNGVLKHSLIY